MQKVITSQFCVTSVDDGRDGNDGNDGTSPWVADFDNEMDSVQCDDSGYVLEEQAVSTNVRLFYGNTQKQLTIISVRRGLTSMTNGTQSSGVKVSWGSAASSVKITVTYSTTAKISGKDDFEITIRSTEDQSVTRVLHFVVNGVKGDVYNLLPSVNEIHATRDKSGNYLVGGSNAFSLRCGYSKRAISGQVTRVNDVSGKIDNKYNIYFNRHKTNGDWAGNWALYQTHKSALDMPGVTNGTLNLATYDAIRFALCENTADTVSVSTGLTGVIDEETVCIVSDGVDGSDGKDGKDGKDGTDGTNGKDGMGGVVAFCTPDKVYAPCNNLGAVVQAVSQQITFNMRVGETPVTPSSVTNNSKPSGVTVEAVSGSANKKTLKVAVDAASSGFSSGAVFTVSGTYNNKTVSAQCTVAIVAGWQGVDGKGIALVLNRTGIAGYTEANWNNWATIGVTDSCSHYADDDDFTKCRVGDYYMVVGYSYDSNLYHEATYRCTKVSASSITGVCISHIKDGQGTAGLPGHVGRWYYYAGVWDQNVGYKFEKTKAPFVKRGNDYYMLDCAAWASTQQSDNTYTSNDEDPADSEYNNGKPWTKMSITFKYIISEAIFTNQASLGSFAINYDWLISKQGTQGSYESFNPTNFTNYIRYGSSYSGFIPNFAVDGNTGRVYMSNAIVKGDVYANNGFFKGGIATPFVRITSEAVAQQYGSLPTSESSYTITGIPDTIGGLQIEWGGKTYINLPSPTSVQLGREFYILNMQSAATTVRYNLVGGTAFKLNKYGLAKLKVIYNPEDYNGMQEHYMWALLDCRNISKRFPSKGSVNDDDSFSIDHEYGHIISV